MASNTSPLLPDADHFIPLDKAKEMTALFRAQKENILAPEYKGKDILTICETFNRAPFDIVLAKPECVGLRLYFGMDPDLKVKVIVVGVNDKNEDILPKQTDASAANGDNEDIIEAGTPCPPWCPDPPL